MSEPDSPETDISEADAIASVHRSLAISSLLPGEVIFCAVSVAQRSPIVATEATAQPPKGKRQSSREH